MSSLAMPSGFVRVILWNVAAFIHHCYEQAVPVGIPFGQIHPAYLHI